uniref:Uncharacterized protein n=1 Tax=Oryza barthii TaxID=65489 RepID=A0A0D3GU47_9ORYZ
MADRRPAYNNTTKARLQKRCPHGGHDIKDAAIAHLRKMWFPPKENSPRKGERYPRQRPQEGYDTRRCSRCRLGDHRVRLSPGTPRTSQFVAHQLSNHHTSIGSAWLPPRPHQRLPAGRLLNLPQNPAASSLHPTAPSLRAGPGHLRPTTRRPPHQVRPKENPDWTVSLQPPEFPLLTSSRLNPTETPHKEGEEFKKGEGADWQQGRRRTAASSHEH